VAARREPTPADNGRHGPDLFPEETGVPSDQVVRKIVRVRVRRRRRRRPRQRLIVGVLVIAAIAGAWLFHAAQDTSREQELMGQFGTRFFTDFDLEPYLPAAQELLAQPIASRTYAQATAAAVTEPEDTRPDVLQFNPEPDPLAPVQQVPTAESIIGRHEARFMALEQVALQKLETLEAMGREEYEQRSAWGSLNRIELIFKYLQAGRLLEKNMDGVFYAMLTDLGRELSQHSHSVDIVQAIEAHYVGQKGQLRSRYLGRVTRRD
jgi:hypothetical protein